MLRFIVLVAVALFGVAACTSMPANDTVEFRAYEPMPRLTLLRGLAHTQTVLLDNILMDPITQANLPVGNGDPERTALMVVYCDLVGRGMLDGKSYPVCRVLSSALSQQCSVSYYRQLAKLDSVHASCTSCLQRLQRCLSRDLEGFDYR